MAGTIQSGVNTLLGMGAVAAGTNKHFKNQAEQKQETANTALAVREVNKSQQAYFKAMESYYERQEILQHERQKKESSFERSNRERGFDEHGLPRERYYWEKHYGKSEDEIVAASAKSLTSLGKGMWSAKTDTTIPDDSRPIDEEDLKNGK